MSKKIVGAKHSPHKQNEKKSLISIRPTQKTTKSFNGKKDITSNIKISKNTTKYPEIIRKDKFNDYTIEEKITKEIDIKMNPKKLEKGKMSINTEQMLKDLAELGRIDEKFIAEQNKGIKNKIEHSQKNKAEKDNILHFIASHYSKYLKIAVAFCIAATIFLISAFYVLNSQATVDIYLKKIKINNDFEQNFDIKTEADYKKNANLLLFNLNFDTSIEDVVYPTGEKIEQKQATGSVRFFNNTNKSQDLIRTTRLMPENSKDIFRLASNITIPAGGIVDAEIYSDDKNTPSVAQNIKFIIPGFKSEEIRAKIYAESISAIGKDVNVKKVVSENDIKIANELIDKKIKEKADEVLKSKIQEYKDFEIVQDSFIYNVTLKKIGASIGSGVESFKISATANVKVLLINKTKIFEMTKEFTNNANNNTVNIDDSSFYYNIKKIDNITKKMTLIFGINSDYYPKSIDDKFSKDDIIGMSIKDLQDYIKEKNFADKVNIRVSPFWLQKMPLLKNNIYINVKKN